ncbi:MAG: endonuclease/exonuclease/phosphatase family protein [Anaerolineae bacterium]|nr:endonuclease/exonuclease/phosphatase family protein [Anaerolineae bacterium]
MKVITFNIKDGGIGREHFILEVFSNTQPDLIFLQEITHADLVHEWAATLKMEYAVAKGHSRRHVAILSRFPIRACSSDAPIPLLSRDVLMATIEVGSLHQLLHVAVVHLTAQPFFVFEWYRLLEVKSMLRRLKQPSGSPCLIAGDFNAVSPEDHPNLNLMAWHIRLMLRLQVHRFPHAVIAAMRSAGFIDCFRSLYDEPGYTLPPPDPAIRFDYFFANEYLKPFLRNCNVIRHPAAVEHASDHFPLLADFAL